MKSSRLIYILLLSLVCSLITAQDTSVFRHLSSTNGLPNNAVKALFKDSVGYIWIGARYELNRFDGHEIKTYDSSFEDDILAIEELDSVTLIVGTATSLFEFDRINDRITRIELDARQARVKAIKRINTNSYLVGTQQAGLYRVDRDKQAEKIILDANISISNHVTAIEKENDDIFWISTANGLSKYIFSQGKTIHYKMEEGANNSNYFYDLSLIDSSIYVGSFNKGVFRFDLNTEKFEKIPDFENDFILSMDDNGAGMLYVGTDGKGIKVFSIDENKIVDVITRQRSHSISSNAVLVTKIFDTVLWLGSLSGVDYTPSSDKQFSTYRTKNLNTADYNIRSIFITKNGGKLIGTRSGLLYVSERQNIVKEYTMENTQSRLRSNIILCIDELQDKIVIGTYGGGLYFFDEETLSLSDFSSQEPFQNGCFFRFQDDQAENLWLATSDGLFCAQMDGTLLRKYDMTNTGLVDHVILFLFRDSMNRMFLATHFGLWVIEPETEIIRSDIFESKYNEALSLINYIYEDSQKNIWFCSNQGVLKVDSDLKPLNYYSGADRIPRSVARSVIEDDNGNIWIATSTQIVKYEPDSEHFFTYQYVDGLTGHDFNNSVFKSHDGTLWWANEGGLIFHNSEENKIDQEDNKHPTITEYFLFNMEKGFTLPVDGKVVLAPSQKDILIKFSYLDYSPPHAEVFEFRLKGYEEEWQKQIGRNNALYTSLPPGDYVFQLRSPNNHDNIKTLSIVVKRSYASIIWFLVAFLLVVSLYLYFSNTIKRMTKKMRGERLALATIHEQTKTKGKTTVNMPEERVEDILNRLLAYVQDEKPYLNPKLKLNTISDKLECSSTELSRILNNRLGVNFADFVNVYRINEVKHLLNNSNLSKYTLKALSEKSGFNSKSTFYRVFKKVTGSTPLEYCNKMNITIVEE